MARKMSFEQACSRFVYRYTMEHIPARAKERPCDHGGDAAWYYAPQFQSDREWYDNTAFHGEPGHVGNRRDCYTSGQTWPLGIKLDKPYRRA